MFYSTSLFSLDSVLPEQVPIVHVFLTLINESRFYKLEARHFGRQPNKLDKKNGALKMPVVTSYHSSFH